MENVNFETSINRLEEIVRALEKGDAPLERSLALFEEGAGLVKLCEGLLTTAEQRVSALVKGDGGQPRETEFDDAQ
jgi:exodeoxyribonuclease VII small subunit